MTIALKKNVPGFRDANGVFRPIRSASYIGSGRSRRPAKAKDRKKYSRAKAGDLGKLKQERALEAPWDREFRLEQEAKAAEKREQDRIEKQIAAEVYGETSGRTSRGKARSLAQFVRSEGGINTKSKVRKGRVRYGDSLENFTRKGSGSTGLVTTTPGKGKSLDYMYQAAREAGYDVASMDDLLDALDNEIRSGKKTYATHGSMTYNPRKTKNPPIGVVRAVLNGIAVLEVELNGDRLYIIRGPQGLTLTSRTGSMWTTKSLATARKKLEAVARKKNPDLLSMFANAAVGIASTLQIKEMLKTRKRPAAPKKRGTTTAKARKVVNGKRATAQKNPRSAIRNPQSNQPNLFKRQPKGDLYVLTIGSGDDLVSVYLHDGDKDGFSKRFKTMAAARAYATRNKVKMVENPAAAKVNGIIKRAWARSRAKSEYGRELRQAAALERTRLRRQKAEQAARSNPRGKKITKAAAKAAAIAAGIDFDADFHSLRFSEGNLLADLAKAAGYRKPASGGGSLGRHFFYHLQKVKTNPVRSTNGKKAVARSAKATPSRRCSCGHIKEGHHANGVGKCSVCTCRKFSAKTFRTLKDIAAAMRKAPARKNPQSAIRNPRSSARRRTFEMFQGRKVTTARPMIVSNHAPARLDQLGDLIELKIAGMARPIRFNGKTAKLCAANGKLWIAGKRFAKANPAAAANEINPIGEIDHVVYGTRKPHHGDHDYTHYIHKLGEESGKRPILCVDREGFPVIRGGNYKIEARGIVD